jgi:SnoaL-like polyketide cyclase
VTWISAEGNKRLVRRLVDESVQERNLDVLDQIAGGEFAEVAKRWVSPFQSAFPDFEMEIVDLIAEGEVVARFKCSGTHLGEWLGVPATFPTSPAWHHSPGGLRALKSQLRSGRRTRW